MPRAKSKNAIVPPTTWPASAPSILEEKVMSVSIGNTHISWAVHEGSKQEFSPTLFWRTHHLDHTTLDPDPSELLSTHLPDEAHALLFGSKTADPTKRSAIQAGADRRVTCLSIYFVSTNDEQLGRVSELFKNIPARMYLMQGDDFFTMEQGRYQGMGLDRLAGLRAAAYFHGFPALVFDGGTAATYTAADANGKIIGGGIGPGVQVKFKSLSDYTGALPYVKDEELRKEIADLTAEDGTPKKVLPVFAKTPKQNIITKVCREIASEGHSVIQHFLGQVGPAVPADGEKENAKSGAPRGNNDSRTVIVTGGDADLIARLLEPDYSKMLELEPGKEVPSPPLYTVKVLRHMVHYGIGCVLMKEAEAAQKAPNAALNTMLMGQRVAKKFEQSDEDGDSIFRGTIAAVYSSNASHPYFVRYDDGDCEDLGPIEIHEALKLYVKVGEKYRAAVPPLTGVAPSPPKGKKAEGAQKVEGAQTAANMLADKNEIVKQAIEQKKKAKNTPPPRSAETGVAPAVAPAERRAEPAAPSPVVAAASSSSKRPVEEKKPSSQKKKKKKTAPRLTKPKKDYEGDRIAKVFGDEIFFGTVREFWIDEGTELWAIIYDDDDKEDLEEKDFIAAVELYKRSRQNDPKAV